MNRRLILTMSLVVWVPCYGADQAVGVAQQTAMQGVATATMGGQQALTHLAQGNLAGALMSGAMTAGAGMQQAQQAQGNAGMLKQQMMMQAMQGVTAGSQQQAGQPGAVPGAAPIAIPTAAPITIPAGGAAAAAVPAATRDPLLMSRYTILLGVEAGEDQLPELLTFTEGSNAAATATKMLNDSHIAGLRALRTTAPTRGDESLNTPGFLPLQEVAIFHQDLMLTYLDHFLQLPPPAVVLESDATPEDIAAEKKAEEAEKKVEYEAHKKAEGEFDTTQQKLQTLEDLLRYFGDIVVLGSAESVELLKDHMKTFVNADGADVPRTIEEVASLKRLLQLSEGSSIDSLTQATIKAKDRVIYNALRAELEAMRSTEDAAYEAFMEGCDDRCGVEDEEGADGGDPAYKVIKKQWDDARDKESAAFLQWRGAFDALYGVDGADLADEKGAENIGTKMGELRERMRARKAKRAAERAAKGG